MDNSDFDAKFEEFMNEPLTTSNDETIATGDEITDDAASKLPEKLWWQNEKREIQTSRPQPDAFLKRLPHASKEPAAVAGQTVTVDVIKGRGTDSVEVTASNASDDHTLREEKSFVSEVATTYEQTSSVTQTEAVSSQSSKVAYNEDFESRSTLTDTNAQDAVAHPNDLGQNVQESTALHESDSTLTAEKNLAVEQQSNRQVLKTTDEVKGHREEVEDVGRSPTEENGETCRNVRSITEILMEAEELESAFSREEPETRIPLSKTEELVESKTHKKPDKESVTSLDLLNLQRMLKEEQTHSAMLSAENRSLKKDARHNLEQQQIGFEEKIFRLQQEITFLKAKLEQQEKLDPQVSQAVLSTEDARWKERYERQMEEQERLLAGYQRENERLFGQVKHLQIAAKDACLEIQRLREQLSRLKETSSEFDLYKLTTMTENGGRVVQMLRLMSNLKRVISALEKETCQKNLMEETSTTVHQIVTSMEQQVNQLEEVLKLNKASTTATSDRGDNAHNLQKENRDDVTMERRDTTSLQSEIATKMVSTEEVQPQGGKPEFQAPTSLSALKKQLASIRERHRREVDKLKGEVEGLRCEAAKRRQVSNYGDRVAVQQARIQALLSEVGAKDQVIDKLQKKVAMLQTAEKRKLPDHDKTKEEKGPGMGDNAPVRDLTMKLEHSRTVMTTLKMQNDEAQAALQASQLKVNDVAAKYEARFARVQNEVQEQRKKISNLRSQCDKQDMIIAEQREKLSQAMLERDKAAAILKDYESLKGHCQMLHGNLLAAQNLQSPQQKDFLALQARVLEVERMYQEKSDELQQFFRSNKPGNACNAEPNRSKCKFYDRDRQLERFKFQLDDMLSTLENIQAVVHMADRQFVRSSSSFSDLKSP